ncbi:hypothetical protein N9B05_05050 [Mariniblastus sp.]|nr:hypothetical protein [Mariniblastus sp.]
MRKFLGCLLLPVALLFFSLAAGAAFVLNSQVVGEGLNPYAAIATASVFGFAALFLMLFSFMLLDSSGRFASWFFKSQAISPGHPIRKSQPELESQVVSNQVFEVEPVAATISGLEMSESDRNDVGFLESENIRLSLENVDRSRLLVQMDRSPKELFGLSACLNQLADEMLKANYLQITTAEKVCGPMDLYIESWGLRCSIIKEFGRAPKSLEWLCDIQSRIVARMEMLGLASIRLGGREMNTIELLQECVVMRQEVVEGLTRTLYDPQRGAGVDYGILDLDIDDEDDDFEDEFEYEDDDDFEDGLY